MGTVTLSYDGPIARLIISNTARRNAMSMSMWQAIIDHVATIEHHPESRVVVVRGDGEQSFVSGADISEFGEQRDNAETTRAYDAAVDGAQQALAQCSKPVIANIHGICMGGGLGLAAACDLRYCADDTRFRMPAARLGLGYRWQGIVQLIDRLGAPRTAEIFYTARIFNGQEAARIGLVHSSHPAEMLDDHVEQVAREVAGNAPLTLRAAKLAIRQALLDPAERDVEAVHAAVRACFDSDDYREGRQAFQEKRPPRFQGR